MMTNLCRNILTDNKTIKLSEKIVLFLEHVKFWETEHVAKKDE
jgi:hypothetical protein